MSTPRWTSPGLAAIWLALAVTSAAEAQQEPLAVMSFNIRYGTADDGKDHWSVRRGMLLDLLRWQDADIVGLQEALDFQIDEIVSALPAYAVVGVGRDDGKIAGEYAAILFRRQRFNVAESGTFWLSDTPDLPASRTWGNRITRICTWARLVDRKGGAAFRVYNVHLDHESQPSRERSTALLAQRIQDLKGREPVLVVGDFNAGEDNPAFTQLLATTPLIDTFRTLHRDEREVGTFTGFTFGKTTGPKIDHVLAPPGTEVLSAGIERFSWQGRYPSDHFPVVARLRLRAAP